ncbi:phage head closure protein [Burkholderia gladioli]|uniref:phage head closure protein n=1 Tax=Burkholderia gladioli TaxID=28095 RepID=UPI00164174FA|nr:phage head closure protein [Burkholderia gladioli]MBU9154203.1 phage head closure protein [Burkholderia gladioli]
MRTGSLNRRVRIERPAGDDDRDPETGQPLGGWVEVATVWASVLLLSGKETLVSDADVGTAQASIRIRFRTDLDNGMRAVLLRFVNGQPVADAVFNIGQPLPDYAGREYTDLPCTEGGNDG